MLRNLITVTFLIMSVMTVEGQVTKRHWLTGGTIDYQHNEHGIGSDVSFKRHNFNLAGRFGYFFIDKLAAGIMPHYHSSKYRSIGAPVYDRDLRIGPFVRYYIFSTDSKINLLLDVYFLKGFQREDGGSPIGRAISNITGFQGGPVFFVNSVVGFELLLGYSSFRYINDDRFFHNQTYLALGIQVHLEREKNRE